MASEKAEFWRRYCAIFHQIKDGYPHMLMSAELIHDEVGWQMFVMPYIREQLDEAMMSEAERWEDLSYDESSIKSDQRKRREMGHKKCGSRMTLLEPVTVRPALHTSDTAPGFAYPHELPLSQVVLFDPSGLYLRSKIVLYPERTDDGRYLVSSPAIMTHGVGDDIESAVLDYQSMLTDLFVELIESENELSAHLADELHYLRSILVEDNFVHQ